MNRNTHNSFMKYIVSSTSAAALRATLQFFNLDVVSFSRRYQPFDVINSAFSLCAVLCSALLDQSCRSIYTEILVQGPSSSLRRTQFWTQCLPEI